MQRILLMAAFVLANVLTMSGAKKTVVERIEPTPRRPNVRMSAGAVPAGAEA